MKAYYLSAALVILALGSCANKKSADEATTTQDTAVEAVTYTGTLPAADCEGIRYTLTLNYDDANKGSYTLEQVYISDLNPATFKEAGDFEQVNDSAQTYLRTVGSAEVGTATADTTYYVVTSDSTIVLTGKVTDMPVAPADYTLTVKK